MNTKRAIDDILAEWERLGTEELGRKADEALATPFGRFLWEINAEAEETLKEIESEEKGA